MKNMMLDMQRLMNPELVGASRLQKPVLPNFNIDYLLNEEVKRFSTYKFI